MNTQTIKTQNLDSAHNANIVTQAQWVAARKQLLVREKALTKLQDQIASERRALPWVLVDKHYTFESLTGPCTLANLFEGRHQLIVQHFMLGPGWEEGCPSCSFMADHTDCVTPHLAQRDVTVTAISRAPIAEIERFRQRMGWQFKWVSSFGSDFNYDFGVSFTPQTLAKGEANYNYRNQSEIGDENPGVSVFYKSDSGEVYHTYSTYGRGVEVMMGTYRFLDLTPLGRDEEPGAGMHWLRHHDRYATADASACKCHSA